MSYTYLVQTEAFGTLRKAEDSIEAARKWAKRALGVGPRGVSREQHYRHCDRCSCAPCDCRKAGR